MDNADQMAKGESRRWILDSIEIDEMADVAFDDDEQPSMMSKSTSPKSFARNTSSLRNRNKMERLQSGAEKGLKSLRFLDITTTGKEDVAWRSVEKRFNQLATDGRLPRNKFGACIGNFTNLSHQCGSCIFVNS